MARSILLVTTSLLATAFFACLPVLAGEGEKYLSGWLLTQKSKICGEAAVYLTAAALKVVDPKTSTTLVSKAPDWKVVVFNTSSKTQYASSFEKFQGYSRLGLQVQVGFTHGGIPLAKQSGTSTVEGTKANIYGTTPQYEKNNRRLFLAGRLSGGAPATARLLTSSGWALPAQEGAILSRLYGVDDTSDIPLDFHCTDQERADKAGLKTLAIKKTTIAAKEFDCPVGYRFVTSMEGVRIDAGGQTAMEDMLKGLDDRIDAKSKAATKPGAKPESK